MDSHSDSEVSISDLFDKFIEASTMRNVLSIHHRILNCADLSPCEFNEFFPRLKQAVLSSRQRKNWKAKALFSKIDKRAAQKCYSNMKSSTSLNVNRTTDGDHQDGIKHEDCSEDNANSQANRSSQNNNALRSFNCLVIGSGPAGLRTAIELQLLGSTKVVIVEKRSRFSRNNVLHLWPFVIDDLKSLGAKKFYGKFCAGSIDHISIRQLQLMLLKVCLMIGCDFRDSCSYVSLCPATIETYAQPLGTTTSNTSDVREGKLSSDRPDNQPSSSEKCDLHEPESSATKDFVKVSSALFGNQHSSNRDSNLPVSKSQRDLETIDSLDGKASAVNDKPSNGSLKNSRENDISKSTPSNLGKSQTKRRSHGALAHFDCESKIDEDYLQSFEWDFIIGADGRRNTLSKFFPRKEFRGRLAIAITANFINRQTTVETSVPEISGLSFIYNQDMFNALAYDTNIQLENICYYKDDTHYFVMTAKKKSLLERGVLISDYAATQDLLSDDNVNREALLQYAKDAAYWTTGLDPLDFALNHYGQEDCAMFDFTSMYAASNACKAIRTKSGGLSLVALVGDSLLEPFWPTGSGCARGFLSSLDAAWMCRQWAINRCPVIDHHQAAPSRSSKNRNDKYNSTPTTYDRMALSVMAERESIYRILAQTTSENLQQNYSLWTLNPHTRYPNLNRHLVLPSQVEHLITDNESRCSLEVKAHNNSRPERNRRIKSPNSLSPRKSPKKLKSANASPITQPRNLKNRSKSLSKTLAVKSRSRPDISQDDTYVEFEQSYTDLIRAERGGMTQYLNYRRSGSDTLDDLFIPSLSGTLPSSNNLQNLEAGRARDIDECLRQRRQKTKINFVRDQLKSQFSGDGSTNSPLGGNVALFNELKRIREQRSRSRSIRPDSQTREIQGPLSLLNSMRRCASFAERVKSFESKLSIDNSRDTSSPTTPKTPIDNVKNLPQFATLQELFINKSTIDDGKVKKSRIPVVKLSKEDWNVKCWEKQLASKKDEQENNGSMRTLNKAYSVDSSRNQLPTPKKQVEVFQDRIKEMADKLNTPKENDKLPIRSTLETSRTKGHESNGRVKLNTTASVRSQGWINHLKSELVRGSASKNGTSNQPKNPLAPNKPISKLFEDDDDDDGIDINKHYDHLCINRPTNKYLPRGSYTSHLTRTRFSTTSKVINRPKPSAESKQAYLSTLASRNSSASSTRSDYSTNTANSSSGSGVPSSAASVVDVECSRCKKFASTGERLTIGNSTLHKSCLACASCGITLRSNEIQHYLNILKSSMCKEQMDTGFICAICKPSIRSDLSREAANRLAEQEQLYQDGASDDEKRSDHRLPYKQSTSIAAPPATTTASYVKGGVSSREEFLNRRIDYNELYKNILIADDQLERSSHSNLTKEKDLSRQERTSTDNELASSNSKLVAPSPIQVTIPLNLIAGARRTPNSDDVKASYRIAESETIDGSEQVTLLLPETNPSTPVNRAAGEASRRNGSSFNKEQREMIDEDELQRILHLDNSNKGNDYDNSSSSSSGDADDVTENAGADGASAIKDHSKATVNLSDDSSSLNSPATTSDDYGDEDDDESENGDQNSTYCDLITSEEFDATSDQDEVDGEAANGDERDNQVVDENQRETPKAKLRVGPHA